MVISTALAPRASRPQSIAPLTILLLLAAALIASCTAAAPLSAVAAQNHANTQALAANIAALSQTARDHAHLQTQTIIQRARECTAADLIRIRASITPDNPTEAELTDPSAPWIIALTQEVDALRARINTAAPPDRPAAADSLADAHPATIDLATSAPGFSPARVLHDALQIERFNRMFETETGPPIRASILAQRNTLLDAYLPARNAAALAATYLAALDRHLATINDQLTIAGLHAKAIDDSARPPSAPASPLALYRDPALRAAILDLIAQTSGDQAAQRLRTQLAALDAALPTRGP